MSLFHRKEEKRSLPEFSRLPELPKFPVYEPEIKMPEIREIKSAVNQPGLLSDIPIRKPQPIRIIERPSPEKIVLEEKPIFVKIDKYKEAIRTIDQIKAKLKEDQKL